MEDSVALVSVEDWEVAVAPAAAFAPGEFDGPSLELARANWSCAWAGAMQPEQISAGSSPSSVPVITDSRYLVKCFPFAARNKHSARSMRRLLMHVFDQKARGNARVATKYFWSKVREVRPRWIPRCEMRTYEPAYWLLRVIDRSKYCAGAIGYWRAK